MLKFYLAATLSVFSALPLAAAELIMVEQVGCVYCELWDREISEIYPKTPEGKAAPLQRMDLQNDYPGDVAMVRAVHFTPTFLIVEDGKELARIEGYPGEDFFWGLLAAHLERHTDFDGSS